MLRCEAPARTARTLEEALALRATMPDAAVLAGGTDLMVLLETGTLAPKSVLNLWGCQGLRGIEGDPEQGLRLGAMTTFADLRRNPGVPAALQDCAATIGAEQIQARATIGGNIVNASPAGDSLPLWLALDAVFEVASVRGRRSVPASAFFLGYRRVDLAPDELLTGVLVPPWRGAWGEDRLAYRKVGTRLAQSISKVVFAGRLRVVDGRVTEARLAMGSVAPTPVRLRSVEQGLEGHAVDPGAAERVPLDVQPIDDVRSTAEYRLKVAKNVVRAWLAGERDAGAGSAAGG